MLICNYCGQSFFESELQNDCCPNCHAEGEYEKAHRCKICGEYFAEDDIEYECCQDCIDEAKEDYRHDLVGLRGIVDDYTKVEINSLYAHYFDKADIDEILFNELKNKKDFIDFIENDEFYFMQQVKKAKGV